MIFNKILFTGFYSWVIDYLWVIIMSEASGAHLAMMVSITLLHGMRE